MSVEGDINGGPVLADILDIWQEAMVKDTLERAVEPNLNLRVYLQNAYVHPVFKDNDFEKPAAVDDEEENPLIKTTRHTRRGSKSESENGGC